MRPLESLQAGRGLAATAVAAFHLSINMGIPRYGGNAVFGEFTRYGDRGVDFFFVLSGFIILLAHHRDIGQPSKVVPYLRKRFVRVFPIYWLYTLAFVLAFLLFGGTDARLPATAGDWLAALFLVRFTAGAPPLEVAWTLFHEVAFYAAFSVLLLNRRIGIAVLAAFALIAVANYHYPREEARTAWSVYTSGYNLFFLLGMGAFLLYRRNAGGAKALIGGLAISCGALAFASVLEDLAPLVVALGFALALVGATVLERRGAIRVPKWLVFLGNASYSIYLTHLAFEGLLLKIAMRLDLHGRIGFGATYLVVLSGAIALGGLAYAGAEKPLLQRLHARSIAKSASAGTAAPRATPGN